MLLTLVIIATSVTPIKDYINASLPYYLLTYLITYLLTPWCRILFEKLIITRLIKKYLAFFTEPEGSSPCSQKPATGPYPELTESSSPRQSLSP
jgi:hypothetical protein